MSGVLHAGRDAGDGTERIVKAAIGELPAVGAILLGAGAATERLAEALPPDRPLTVVTNAPSIAQTLAPRATTAVVLVGGRLDRDHPFSIDAWALEGLARVHVDVAFVVPDGVSLRRGLTARDLAAAAVQRAILAAADRTVLLAGRAAIGTDHVVRFGDVADVDVVITEADLDDDTTADLASRGPQVVRV